MKKILSLTLVVVMLMSAFVYAQASTLRDGGARTAADSAASDRTHADSKEDAKVVSTAEPCDSAKQLPQDDINMRKNPSEESSAEEPYIVKVYDANDCVDIHTAVNYKGGLYEAQARLKTHYLMSDGTWRIGESYAKGHGTINRISTGISCQAAKRLTKLLLCFRTDPILRILTELG